MSDAAPALIVQCARPLVVICEDCGRDVHPQFEATPAGFRQLPAYCPCGWLTPEALIEARPSGETAVAA